MERWLAADHTLLAKSQPADTLLREGMKRLTDMRAVWRILAASIVVVLVAACGNPTPDAVVQHLSMRLTNSSASFGLQLVDHLLVEPDAGNVFVSPLSATLMLSMAASAAEGKTQAAMLNTLGLDPSVDPSAEARQTIERLTQSDANIQVELAQAVWAEAGLALSPAYFTKLRNDYKAQVSNLDFQSPNAPAAVNHWVDSATHHKITQLVDGFDPNVVAYLANATYFHGLWRSEFESHGSADFHTFGGTAVKVPMMQRTENVTMLTTPTYVGALLPYKGGRFSALLLLPKQLLAPGDFAKFLTAASWGQTIRYLHTATGTSLGANCKRPDTAPAPDVGIDCEGTLVMPKFTLEYKKDLTKTLGAMGMPVGPGASLPGFCSGCFLSDVVQKTYLQVDEKGTTAAAASGGNVATAAHIPVVVDRPFAFALIDSATDAPLFLGAIGDL